MRIIDSHFHWWPRSVSERLCKRKSYPRAMVNDRGGYTYLRQDGGDYVLNSWAEWFDLDKQLEHMDALGHEVDVVCSIGPLSVYFSDLPAEEGRDAAILAQIGVAATIVDRGPRIALALAERVGDRPRPPVEVGIDDVHVERSAVFGGGDPTQF